ncbi:MAG: PBECR2 nuclease fold domain-containing protein [Lentihominibacter sp.]|uniref:PBECR3 domain-containing polyvalent protein n=1 Tax=Lentihominibacter sp. TaxID=2944216 RepID=UPI002A90B5BF|nr:PBECR2 nuclease fold domain-containing protein [Lentihominibacter sp.]MDY5286189.1 PBECR2 nuclease fold domain-containing protein [Lentihominibacter sp.]
MKKRVGKIDKRVIQLLHLSVNENEPIYIGASNIRHMKTSHAEDYLKYGSYINVILSSPEYVGINKKDNSIEYVKSFTINNEYLKVAVRVSNNGVYYARSLYVLNSNRVKNFIKKQTLLQY